jgi:DNA polymerase (family 10)
MGEMVAAEKGKLPELVEVKDIRGLFHIHSNWSDGHAPVEDMVRTAQKLGLEYVGLTEHSPSAAYAHGLKVPDLLKWMKEVDVVQKKFPKIRLFKGTECDILPDGRLDYPDEILAKLDFVVGSVHQNFTMKEADMTARIIRAMENKYLTILGHPTGRLLLERGPYAINMKEIIDAAARTGVIIEINAHPKRLDLDWRWGKYAKEKGVRISIDPDAHKTDGIADFRYGVGIARKGWLEKKNVINTIPAAKILRSIRRY